ncbi:hypothetical protein FLGE108171_07615 [Flavobacterium gelidilacus]|uniref:hypothetical protein n=1 Tax=Flavobacterium gelidilacus TaxID=206041 RepID=UPI00040F9F59|nr:hypothetical protein [Flavobacterium gelidilacus]
MIERGDELIIRNKEIISDIIIKFNTVEKLIKEIISKYISSEKTTFINDILLNNLILNFSSKFKILSYIIEIEKINIDKNLNNSIKNIMTFRNIIAHSDNLIDYEIISLAQSDLSFTLNLPRSMSPMQKVESKKQTTLNSGKINEIEIEKIHKDFIKHFNISFENLGLINKKLQTSIPS